MQLFQIFERVSGRFIAYSESRGSSDEDFPNARARFTVHFLGILGELGHRSLDRYRSRLQARATLRSG